VRHRRLARVGSQAAVIHLEKISDPALQNIQVKNKKVKLSL
jgi:hypothetical protein